MALESLSLEDLEGKYEIIRKLREGGMGAIYKVRHRLLDEVRVIKVIHPQHEEDEGLQRRFHREAKTAIRLRHPNIAQLYDFSINDEGSAYIVMEFIEGITFQEMLSRGNQPSLGLGIEIALQGLEAIGYLHQQGFVHRDISPDNLMISKGFDGGPSVKLIDLGIAKSLERGGDLTATGTFLGKVRYCAPEGFAGDSARVTPQSDIYSFGMLAYELFTGRCPILGESFSELVSGHLFRPPMDFEESDPNGRIPQGLRDALLQSLAKEPENRTKTARDFAAGLKEHRIEGVSWAEELEERLRLATDRLGDPTSIPDPGSTQDRLNRHFELEATSPAPATAPKAPPKKGAGFSSSEEQPVSSEKNQTSGRNTETSGNKTVNALLANAELLARLEQVDKARLELHRLLQLEPQHRRARELLASLGAPEDGRTEVLPIATRVTDTERDVHALLRKAGLKQPGEEPEEKAKGLRPAMDPDKTWIHRPRKPGSQAPKQAPTDSAPAIDRIGEAASSIRASLASGNEDLAQQQLDLALSLYGEDPRLDALRQQLTTKSDSQSPDEPASDSEGSASASRPVLDLPLGASSETDTVGSTATATSTSPLRQQENEPEKKKFSWLLWTAVIILLLGLVLLAVLAG